MQVCITCLSSASAAIISDASCQCSCRQPVPTALPAAALQVTGTQAALRTVASCSSAYYLSAQHVPGVSSSRWSEACQACSNQLTSWLEDDCICIQEMQA